jgi:uncharacterized protein YndB with AHSA1/START domain
MFGVDGRGLTLMQIYEWKLFELVCLCWRLPNFTNNMDIKQTIGINADAMNIYDAVATQRGIEGWWSKNCTIATAKGEVSEIKFLHNGQTFVMNFRIDTLDPSRRVVWGCIGNSNPNWIGTTITYDIQSHGANCTLTFKHTGFQESYNNQMEGDRWAAFLESLKSYCETGTGQPE